MSEKERPTVAAAPSGWGRMRAVLGAEGEEDVVGGGGRGSWVQQG